MKRTPTNFGPYENEYRARVSWRRRWLVAAIQLGLVMLGVLLAGYFLFPMGTPSNDGISTLPVSPAPAASAPLPAASEAERPASAPEPAASASAPSASASTPASEPTPASAPASIPAPAPAPAQAASAPAAR